MDKDKAYILDILNAANLALSFVKDKSKQDFLKDIQCQDAVIRRLEMIGEASGRISQETKLHYPQIPWDEMKGMRNFLIHEYDSVDLHIIWETLTQDLPSLIETLQKN